MQVHAFCFASTQGKTRVANLHQQRIAAHGTAGDHAHRLAADEAEFTQTPRNGVGNMSVFDFADYG